MEKIKYAIDGADMTAIDKNTIDLGVENNSLMELASNGVYNFIKNKYEDVNKILIVAGRGNNGGDGICLARRLLTSGYKVDLFVCKASKESDLFKSQLKTLINIYGEKIILKEKIEELANNKYDLLIDAVFGNGLSRDLNDYYNNIIKIMNKIQSHKLAIDMPSGLSSSTGIGYGEIFSADYTITFHASKIGMLINEGVKYSGKIVEIDIGLVDNINLKSKINIIDKTTYNFYMDKVKTRSINSHKYSYGVVGISLINESMIGAGILAAKAAYRAGCGLVKIYTKSKLTSAIISNLPEAVCHICSENNVENDFDEFMSSCDITIIGPGLGQSKEAVDLVLNSLKKGHTILYDASALRIIGDNLQAFEERKCKCLLTPHVGEMAGLINCSSKEVLHDMIKSANRFSEKYKVKLVLKSSRSIICAKENYINVLGNNALAVAGSGDVLSGIMAALVASGNDFDTSLICAVAEHAMSSERYVEKNESRRMIASDISENIFVK